MSTCKAQTRMGGVGWGNQPFDCELGEGHEGQHQATVNACLPVAVLYWPIAQPTPEGG